MYQEGAWRIKDWNGVAGLKQDGSPVREVTLLPGVEVTIGHRTFIAESERSIALHRFCSRLLGWGEGRIAVVDQALRAIRLASAARTALVLSGGGDLIPIAHSIHRHTLGDRLPFIVSDPRRKNTLATVRSPENCVRATDAFRKAFGGTLCVRARRLPPDFEEMFRIFQEPGNSIRLTICSRRTPIPDAAQIEIPSLDARRADLPRIVSEYTEDVIDMLDAPRDCLDAQDIEWIMNHAVPVHGAAIPDVETAVLRAVALKLRGNLTKSAALLGMARASLERWMKRRNGQ